MAGRSDSGTRRKAETLLQNARCRRTRAARIVAHGEAATRGRRRFLEDLEMETKNPIIERLIELLLDYQVTVALVPSPSNSHANSPGRAAADLPLLACSYSF